MNRNNVSLDNDEGGDNRLEQGSDRVKLVSGNRGVPLPVTLNDGLVPLTAEGRYVPNHLDASGLVHWFSIVDAPDGTNPEGEPYQMRYFRAMQGAQGEILYDSYPVMPLTRADWSPGPLPQLELLLEDGELAAAQMLANGTAERYELPSPDLTQLPPLGELAPRTAYPSTPIEQFHSEFAQSAYRLLEPLDPVVNYSFEVMAVDPWTEELTADKWWFGESGRIEHEGVTLATYSVDWPEFEKALEHEHALIDRDTLHRINQEEGLEAAMQRAEGVGLIYGELDPNRTDGRLFHDGPADRFTTRRESELGTPSKQSSTEEAVQITPGSNADKLVVPPEPGSWEELFQLPDNNELQIERHYWQLWMRPVVTPDETALGHALFCTEFPELPPDFDQYVDEFGMDDSIYPTQARTVEMADFRTEAEARNFGDEFRKYLVPDVINGPELASDVAKLEGLSGEWVAINYDEIVHYMSGKDPVIRDRSDWHVHDPFSELEADHFPQTHESTGAPGAEANGRVSGHELIDTTTPPLEL